MKYSSLDKYIPYILAAIFGISSGYFVSCLVFYALPVNHNIYGFIKSGKRETSDANVKIKTIMMSNVFSISTGINTVISHKKIKVVSNINGYKLVGFVSGEDSMALFKRLQKPVVIVTKRRGINNVWFLYKIGKDGVYIKNKKSGEIKKFEFPSITEQLSIFGKKVSVTYSKMLPGRSRVEKVTINKNILKKIGNINTLLRQINIVPVFKNSRAFGYRINYLSQNSMLRKIGLKVGDIIISINGEPTTNPNKIMGIYSQINRMTEVNLDIIRNGMKKTIFVDIK